MGFRTQLAHCFAASLCIVLTCSGARLQSVGAQEISEAQRTTPAEGNVAVINSAVHLSYAQFHIPFNIDHSGSQPVSVQLYVSTDGGATWQLHGRTHPTAQHFEFRAAAEGEYLFTVNTVDTAGVAFPSPNPPLRVLVDTTKPQTTVQAELDHNGNLIVDLRALDPNLNTQSGVLRIRTDRDSTWREVAIDPLSPVGDHFEGQVEVILPPCREVVMIFSIMDLAKNSAEASFRYSMPRTAIGQSDMQLASGRSGRNASTGDNLPSDIASHAGTAAETASRSGSPAARIPGVVRWDAEAERQIQEASSLLLTADRVGQLTGNRVDVRLEPGPEINLSNPSGPIEELPLPQPVESNAKDKFVKLEVDEPINKMQTVPAHNLPDNIANPQTQANEPAQRPDSDTSLASEVPDSQSPFYSKSRTFSLDYSVEAMGGTLLSDVELWGTEDGGATWQKWGTDPDRLSPFDVRVGNDGLFGFRMVLVGQGGHVLGQPNSGDTADVWIHVDVEVPICKITRAVYGEGSEAGMLVIDYNCFDSQLPDHPISFSYSSTPGGPWTTFASGLKNSGLYLWKVDSDIPNKVFLKLEAVDKAGNTGAHRMELPIDIKGLSPRGRIQGFRPIYEDTGSDAVN